MTLFAGAGPGAGPPPPRPPGGPPPPPPRRNAFLAEMHKRADKVPEKTVKTL